MKRTTFNNLGGLQSLFFCAGIYTVALFFSIFICSSVFYAVNPKKTVNVENGAAATKNTIAAKQMLASIKP
ncbi:MAG: hypothetical protein EAZ16_08740 [Sphingobacteriales bacterium]|nr:MAG: hypothetical protein EAZ16_08740 [Sphingobacteriales bacterium]